MDRRVTPPKRVTSPIWGPPPPCKQVLINIYHINNNKAFTRKHEIAGFQCHAETKIDQNKNQNHSTDKVQNLREMKGGSIQRPSPRFGSKE